MYRQHLMLVIILIVPVNSTVNEKKYKIQCIIIIYTSNFVSRLVCWNHCRCVNQWT
jgi:uncharacterized membrane protein